MNKENKINFDDIRSSYPTEGQDAKSKNKSNITNKQDDGVSRNKLFEQISKDIKKIGDKYKLNIVWGAMTEIKSKGKKFIGSVYFGKNDITRYDFLDLLESGSRLNQFVREYVRDMIFRELYP